MLPVGFLVWWFGYQQVIFGWALLKGWNVTWAELANPLTPYQWPPPGKPIPTIPSTSVLPTSAKAGSKAFVTVSGGPPPVTV